MTSIQNRREQVLAEAVVSAYINELSTRVRPSRRPAREQSVARVARRGRQRPRPRPVFAQA